MKDAGKMDNEDSQADDHASQVDEGVERRGKGPQNHRTVDRVTQIVEEVVYHPGLTFAELARALDAPKSSVYGFLQGLLAKGWLYEQNRRFYLGPAVYGLTLASGRMRADLVSHEDMAKLHSETGITVFLGVRAGHDIISIAEFGSHAIADFEARSSIRRTLIGTAAGKALLTTMPQAEVEAYLRTRPPADADRVATYLAEYQTIRRTRIATNLRLGGTRFAIAACIRDGAGDAVAAVTLVGPTEELQPREEELGALLLKRIDSWSRKRQR